MPRQRAANPKATTAKPAAGTSALGSMPAAAALSFLRETRGLSTWTTGDMANSLKISIADAKQVISILELQGYVKRSGSSEWMTTLAGESVSGSKTPRYTPARIEKALADLRSRIAEINRDSRAPYKVSAAVAFGDFLSDRSRVQTPEVGVHLTRRNSDQEDPQSAEERKAQQQFMQQLQGRGRIVRVRPYENWMSARTHRKLL
jgi:hypothetical protein